MTLPVWCCKGDGSRPGVLEIIANAQTSEQAAATSIGAQEQMRAVIEEGRRIRTGMAGEILQKFSTYQVQLAIVGDFSEIISKSLKDFIYESNKMGRINFLPGREEALSRLSQK